MISGPWKGLLLDAGVPKSREVNCIWDMHAAVGGLCEEARPDPCPQRGGGGDGLGYIAPGGAGAAPSTCFCLGEDVFFHRL